MGNWRNGLGMFMAAALVGAANGQIDPTKRELIQLGYNANLQGHAPLSGYAFYYLNLPSVMRTNYTLRMALAPVYLDTELGIGQALGPNTDLGVGVAGGGFADSYAEIRQGKYRPSESFTGHGGGVSSSIYHRFNPNQGIPLYGIVRGEAYGTFYTRDSDTSHNFDLPEDRANFAVRSGLRYGGQEPLISPSMAMELSVWHEALFRSSDDFYGFANDRKVEEVTHLFWTRGLLAYTLPELEHTFAVNLTMGLSIDADRFSAYRLGGVLPMAAEFPLTLPGYYFQELSGDRFVLLGGQYSIPLNSTKRWMVNFLAATAGIDYLEGMKQEGNWHSGVGAGIGYRSRSDAWQIQLGYAYGIDAIRNGDCGAHSVGILIQFDLERASIPMFEPGQHPVRSRGLQRILNIF